MSDPRPADLTAQGPSPRVPLTEDGRGYGEPHRYRINKTVYTTSHRRLTGADLRLCSMLPADYELYRMADGGAVPVGSTDWVEIEEGMEFRMVPPGIFGATGEPSWMEQYLANRENASWMQEAALIVEVTEQILLAMERRGVTKAVLAKHLGTSRANVTQLLDGKRNLTLRTLNRIAEHLGCAVAVTLVEAP